MTGMISFGLSPTRRGFYRGERNPQTLAMNGAARYGKGEFLARRTLVHFKATPVGKSQINHVVIITRYSLVTRLVHGPRPLAAHR
jgi:hypothetical protein